ncbi:unnamed protein product [Ectocarpus sp. 12 AP-2014]
MSTCPGKELKLICHFAVGARGAFCWFQVVSYCTLDRRT